MPDLRSHETKGFTAHQPLMLHSRLLAAVPLGSRRVAHSAPLSSEER